MAFLIAVTLLAIVATGVVALRDHALQAHGPLSMLAPLDRLLDLLGHDAQALAQAHESPSL